MDQKKEKRRKKETGILLFCFCALISGIYLYLRPNDQIENMITTRAIAGEVNEAIQEKVELSYVSAREYTGLNGSLLLFGHVKEPQDLTELKEMIDSFDIRCPITWQVNVIAPGKWDETIQILSESNKSREATAEAAPPL